MHTLRCDALPPWLAADANRLRGEFVLVLHAAAPAGDEAASAAHDRVLDALLAALPLKQAVALAAQICGAPRNALYTRALELRAPATIDDEANPRTLQP